MLGKLLEPAVQSLTRLIERSRRLQKKRADLHRLRQYVERWVSWLHGGLKGLVRDNRKSASAATPSRHVIKRTMATPILETPAHHKTADDDPNLLISEQFPQF